MATEIYLTKVDGKFCGSRDEDRKKLARVKEGEEIKVKFSKPRNIKFHKKYFALLNCAVFHMPESVQERIPNVETLLFEVKLQLGHFDQHVTLNGHLVYMTKSISFASMDDIQFGNSTKTHWIYY